MNALLLSLALALTAPAPAVATDAAAWMGVKGATAELVDEPVFDGNVMLYRAGPRGADPVVLVHGLGPNGARDWARTVPALAQQHEVFALDLPGFGLSDKGDRLYTPDNFARVIDRAIAPRVGRPFTLVGHSLGGAVALAVAGAHPQRVKRLVLVDMAGVLHGAVYAESLARLGVAQATGLPADAPWFDALLRTALARVDALPVSRELVLQTPALRQRILRGDPGMIAAFALGEHDFSEALRNVSAPTLIVWGGDDQVAPLRTAHLAAARIAGARLQILPGVGHAPQLQDPARFNVILLDELAGRSTLTPYAAIQRAGPLLGAQSCDGKNAQRYSGDIAKLTLIGCRGAVIENARIGELRVLESDVTVINSDVRGGIYALRSRVELTAGSVSGAPALQLQDSEIDAAGTRFESPQAIAANLGDVPVTLRLSVAEVRRGGKAPRDAHALVRVAPKVSW